MRTYMFNICMKVALKDRVKGQHNLFYTIGAQQTGMCRRLRNRCIVSLQARELQKTRNLVVSLRY